MTVVKSIESVTPVKPTPLFDIARLRSPEYRPFVYQTKYGFDDMLAAGYIHAVAPYLVGVESEILVDEDLGERTVGNILIRDRRAVVRVTITLAYRTTASGFATKEMRFQGLAEGTTTEPTKAVKEALIRVVETRALKRAVGRALNISIQAINGKVFIPTEEDGVPSEFEVGGEAVETQPPAATLHATPRVQVYPAAVAGATNATTDADAW